MADPVNIIPTQSSRTLSTNVADQAIAFARAQIGKPYRYGFTGPNYYDCSGLVQAAFLAAGIKLPRTTTQQMTVGVPVKRNDLKPGDLVFPDPGHVQIYVGNDEVIEAPRTGLNVRQVKMWGFLAARRVTEPGTSILDIITDPIKSAASTGYQQLVEASTAAFEALPGVKQVETLGSILEKLSDVDLWKRIGIGAVGVFMILAGIGIMARKPAGRAAEAVATRGLSEVKKAGNSGTGNQ